MCPACSRSPDGLLALMESANREFVPKKEIDELYLNSPYYLVPDGEVGQPGVRCHS
jgi:hypothetical protein